MYRILKFWNLKFWKLYNLKIEIVKFENSNVGHLQIGELANWRSKGKEGCLEGGGSGSCGGGGLRMTGSVFTAKDVAS